MANITPNQIFSGYEFIAATIPVTADSLVIPISLFSSLSETEADPDTGDAREVIRQLDILIDAAFQAIPEIDRPTKMTSSVSSQTLTNGNRRITVNRTYEVLAPLAMLEMAPEE